jgi:hypothetical protein
MQTKEVNIEQSDAIFEAYLQPQCTLSVGGSFGKQTFGTKTICEAENGDSQDGGDICNK